MSNLIISELAIYPVKSMRQTPLKKSEIDMGGLKHDRRWMVVDAKGVMLTQRKLARLCLIQPELINPEIDCSLLLHAPDMPEIKVSVPDGAAKRKVKVWRDEVNACDGGDEIAAWLSRFLDLQCRLVYFPDNEIRIVDQSYARPEDHTAFSDGFPILLTTQASLDDLNSRMNETITMVRFRPNIVISGSEAFAEDYWKILKVGDIFLRIVKPCSRCVIPSIDIASAERGSEPTKTLITYRKHDNKIIFGQNVIADGHGIIEIGMQVEVVE
ncbi:MAG: MOSC N-terminal beta barrel domain-containing protein [Gammaproteobacteria bacterium]|nr:MOSC N-terminal beta barrel domain-containing protein [Gammaproteobacteria bacterium]